MSNVHPLHVHVELPTPNPIQHSFMIFSWNVYIYWMSCVDYMLKNLRIVLCLFYVVLNPS
jgi:hypothetical protein